MHTFPFLNKRKCTLQAYLLLAFLKWTVFSNDHWRTVYRSLLFLFIIAWWFIQLATYWWTFVLFVVFCYYEQSFNDEFAQTILFFASTSLGFLTKRVNACVTVLDIYKVFDIGVVPSENAATSIKARFSLTNTVCVCVCVCVRVCVCARPHVSVCMYVCSRPSQAWNSI